MNIEFFFNYMLQNKSEVIKQALRGELPSAIVKTLIGVSLLSFAVFGFMIGSSHSILQGVVSFIKLPILFYITGIICFPTLYIFLSLFGLQVSFKGLSHFCVIAISIMSLILIAFAPVSLFFLVVGTHYEVFKMLNVAMMAVAGFSGVYIFKQYILSNAPEDFSSESRTRASFFIKVWLLMFALIGANLGFAMSPIFGNPTVEFILFTEADQNFFSHILSILFNR
ncbi:MAG: hypothetical protein COA58_12990 [Bacteroidetes bacterium]|nr:MAG: hypothetical protein COA58_12990 [Bacteroidota bacterium]